MAWKATKLGRFGQATRGASAVEFAMIFPALLILMLFGVQLVVYVNAVRKVEMLATSMSEMLSQATPSSYATTIATVNQLDLHFSYDSALVLFPYLMKDAAQHNMAWWQDITIDYASVQFIANGQSCSTQDKSACYAAYVVWTTTGTVGSNARPCSVLPPLPPLPGSTQQPADNTAAPSKTTLPRSIFGPGSIIVVDIIFTFKPTFGSKFMPSLPIKRSVYVQPRYASLINYDLTNSDGIATKCPGY